MHILNLIAKSILKHFDVPKAKLGRALSTAIEALSILAGDIESEEVSMLGICLKTMTVMMMRMDWLIPRPR